jgi:hypothetical protein
MGVWGSSAMVRVVRQALSAHEGDVLCFLPGAGEIRRVQTLLEDTPDCDVLPLYGVHFPVAHSSLLSSSPFRRSFSPSIRRQNDRRASEGGWSHRTQSTHATLSTSLHPSTPSPHVSPVPPTLT